MYIPPYLPTQSEHHKGNFTVLRKEDIHKVLFSVHGEFSINAVTIKLGRHADICLSLAEAEALGAAIQLEVAHVKLWAERLEAKRLEAEKLEAKRLKTEKLEAKEQEARDADAI